ncbi:MAG: hypothetical protein KGJ43_05190 [Acidobacteriota bacterium]|nr:hypothetical protein [Acidobacteriota bacterium]
MSIGHLCCRACQVRLRAGATEVDLLDGMCPVCGSTLEPAARAADALGFRSFDWSMIIGEAEGEPAGAAGRPIDLSTRREPLSAPDDLDSERSLDRGGGLGDGPAAKLPHEIDRAAAAPRRAAARRSTASATAPGRGAT